MYELLVIGYELVCGLLPFGLMLRLCGKRFALTGRQRLWLSLFAVYIIGVFYVTGAGTVYDSMRASFENLHRRVNLIPFSREIDWVGYALNVVMLLPMGYLMPKLLENRNSWCRVLTAGFGLSLLIEVSQLLTHRGTDVDDLIMNTLGAALGWLMYQIWQLVSGDACCRIPGKLLGMTVGVIFAGRFFLFNMLGLINWIYGF